MQNKYLFMIVVWEYYNFPVTVRLLNLKLKAQYWKKLVYPKSYIEKYIYCFKLIPTDFADICDSRKLMCRYIVLHQASLSLKFDIPQL